MKHFKNRREQHNMTVVSGRITKAMRRVGYVPDYKNVPRWRQRVKAMRGVI